MKRIVFCLITTMLLLCMSLVALTFAADEAQINVMYHGKYIMFDTPPIESENQRILVPVRAVFEAIGASVNWDENAKIVTATQGETVVTMTLGEKKYTVNGEAHQMDEVLTERDGRVLAPARYAAESFGKTVSYHDESQTVVISDSYSYEFYEKISTPIPTFASVTGCALASTEKEGRATVYYYDYENADVSEYFNALQSDFGYSAYGMDFNDGNGTLYTYALRDCGVVVGDGCQKDGVSFVKIVPDCDSKYAVSEKEKTPAPEISKPEINGENDKTDEDTEDQGTGKTDGINAEYDYATVTGAKFIDVYDSDDKNEKVYRYSFNPRQESAYESYLMSNGWVLYDFDFDMNSFATTKYFYKGGDMLSVTAAHSYGEVWVCYPEKQ